MNSLKERWAALDRRMQLIIGVGGPILLYLLLLHAPGFDSYLHKKAPPGVILQGVVFGVVYALGAFGLILIYRANRFINFAHGALGSLVGVLAIGMVLQHHVSYWIMLPVGVVAGIAVGALTELLVIRRFRNSSRLVLTVASIGLAQVFGVLELGGSKAINFISLVGPFKPPLNVHLTLDHVQFGGDHALVAIVAPLVILGLAWFLLKTDAGIAVRASAENVDRALLLGIPVRRLATIVWSIAGGLAALSFILTASFQGVKPGAASQGPTVLLPLLATAVVARMESLPLGLVAGVGLGIVESITRWNTTGAPSIIYLVYLVVIIGALFAQRGRLSRAHDTGQASWSATGIVKPTPAELRSLPEVRWPKIGLLTLLGLAFVFIPKGWSVGNQSFAASSMVWAMMGVSLVVLTGWGGNISLGQFGLVGAGGVVAANLISHNNADMFVALTAAGLTGAAIALLVGLPALRIRGLFLAVTTLTFAIALDQYFLNKKQFPHFIPDSFQRPLLWERFDLSTNYDMYVVCLAFLALSVLACVGVRKARSGRVLFATRDNQRAADAASVPTTSIKLSGFLLSGAIAGVAGGLYVIILRTVGEGTGTFDAVSSITVFAYSVIGGLGSLTGAIIGVLLFRYLETLHSLGDARPLISGAGLLLVLLFLPGGLGQIVFSLRDRYLKWVANRRGILVPSLVADKRATEDRATEQLDMLRGALSGAPTPAAVPTEEEEPEPVGAGL
jgi:branched-chain amino acid transport system permease protein